MATAEEAVLARKEAVDLVSRLLQAPEDLKMVTAYRDDYVKQRAASKEELQGALSAQMQEIRAGIGDLGSAQKALAKFEHSFASIEVLCNECEDLLRCHESIRRLAVVHSNLRQTLQSADVIANLPRRAAEAERLLEHNTAGGFVHAYVCIAELEATAIRVQGTLDAISNQGGARPGQLPTLSSYFAQAHRAMAKLEERLWSTFRGFRDMACHKAGALVDALQVIEIQEKVDAELLAAGEGGSRLVKRWRRRCMQQIASSVQESFAPVLQQSSKVVAAGSESGVALSDVLQTTGELVLQLKDVHAHVVPCFPPQYKILTFVCEEYHRHVGSVIDLSGLSAAQLSNGDILRAMAWVSEYQAAIAKLGVTPETYKFDASPKAGTSLLLDAYVSRTAATLDSWLVNLVEVDFASEPRVTSEGQVWTPGAVDLYRILDEQLTAASKGGPALVARVANEAARTLYGFQAATHSRLGNGLQSLELLCAIANNSERCETLGKEFANRVRGMLLEASPASAVDATTSVNAVAEACGAFVGLGNDALHLCAEIVFSDPGFGHLFARVGCSDEWVAGTSTGSIIATLDDFMQDFERLLRPGLNARLGRLLASECFTHILAAVVTQLQTVREEDLNALQRDAKKLSSFFETFVPPKEIGVHAQPLLDLAEFLASDSVESFVLSYTTFLGSAPGITPVLLSNLLAARVASDGDMTKADAKEVLEACRQVYVAQPVILQPSSTKHHAVGGTLSKTRTLLPLRRDAAFLAALNAARKKPAGTIIASDD